MTSTFGNSPRNLTFVCNLPEYRESGCLALHPKKEAKGFLSVNIGVCLIAN